MKERLKRFYRAHSDSKLLKGLLCAYRKGKVFLKDTKAAMRLLRWKKKIRGNGPARVCFVQQDPNCWNKSKALYDLLKQDARFSVHLICMPDPFDPNTASTYEFFQQKGYDAIDARIGEGPWDAKTGQGQWYDLKGLCPDYVFYQQPYDAYLPEGYRSYVVSKYARLCHTPYGFALIKELLECMERDFCRYVYRTYSVSELEQKYNQSQFPISHFLKLRKAAYYSPLVFANFFQEQDKESPSWDFSHNSFRAIWTPRWTTDEKLGGSNFFQYKDFLPAYADAHPDMDLLLRPHPMAFDNFIRTGQMTPEEVAQYIADCNSRKNTAIDTAKNYDATFWQSSVLISDVSAVIVEYFVTGKPIIFCRSGKQTNTYLENFQKICSCCYIAENQQELAAYLQQLQAGNDPLQEKRKAMIRELFGEDPTQAPQRIMEDLLADYRQ